MYVKQDLKKYMKNGTLREFLAKHCLDIQVDPDEFVKVPERIMYEKVAIPKLKNKGYKYVLTEAEKSLLDIRENERSSQKTRNQGGAYENHGIVTISLVDDEDDKEQLINLIDNQKNNSVTIDLIGDREHNLRDQRNNNEINMNEQNDEEEFERAANRYMSNSHYTNEINCSRSRHENSCSTIKNIFNPTKENMNISNNMSFSNMSLLANEKININNGESNNFKSYDNQLLFKENAKSPNISKIDPKIKKCVSDTSITYLDQNIDDRNSMIIDDQLESSIISPILETQLVINNIQKNTLVEPIQQPKFYNLTEDNYEDDLDFEDPDIENEFEKRN